MKTNPRISQIGAVSMLVLNSAGRLVRWSAFSFLLALTLTSCGDVLDNLISVEAPSQVAAEDLDDPSNADLLVTSAVNEFRCALVHYIGASAYVGNEWGVGADLGGSSYVWYDNRVFTPGGWTSMYATGDCSEDLPNVYEPLSTARWMADVALERLDVWTDDEVPNRTELTAKAAAFAGYSLTLLGEGMCEAALDLGPAMTSAELLAEADARFSTAITAAQAVGDDEILNVARVGRARVRLNLGQTGPAASDAGDVPAGFSYEFQYSSLDDATENKLYALMRRSEQANVEPMYRNMTFLGVPDPRVVVVDQNHQAPGTTIDMWAAEKYNSLESPVEVATWEEAQLILAEVALLDGRLQEAVDIINVLHGQTNPVLPDFVPTVPLDYDEIEAQLIYERNAELFLEGQHLQDIKRLGIPLVPAPGTPAVHGGEFSNQTCFPLPDVEHLNNPNINR